MFFGMVAVDAAVTSSQLLDEVRRGAVVVVAVVVVAV